MVGAGEGYLCAFGGSLLRRLSSFWTCGSVRASLTPFWLRVFSTSLSMGTLLDAPSSLLASSEKWSPMREQNSLRKVCSSGSPAADWRTAVGLDWNWDMACARRGSCRALERMGCLSIFSSNDSVNHSIGREEGVLTAWLQHNSLTFSVEQRVSFFHGLLNFRKNRAFGSSLGLEKWNVSIVW